MATRRQKKIEWAGGLASLPGYVTAEGEEPYRPEALLWIDGDGKIVGTTVVKAGDSLASAVESLREAMERPLVGRPRVPSCVRVASTELAEVLRAGVPDVEFVSAPTPEVDAVAALLGDDLQENAEDEQTYLSTGLEADAMESLFEAAAALYRARPWDMVPDDQCLVSVSIESLGLRDGTISIIGQMGESRGWLLFAGRDDFEAFLDAAECVSEGEGPSLPPHFGFSFERGADLPPALRKEIAVHQWEVASKDAFPWLVAVDADMIPRPPTSKEVTIAEAIAWALPSFLASEAVQTAWDQGSPAAASMQVDTAAGTLEVVLSAPIPREKAADGAHEGEELLRRFAASPEGAQFSDVGFCRFLVDFARDWFDASAATLRPRELREIVFELIPRKMAIEASDAREVVDQLKAFYGFLEQEEQIAKAEPFLAILGGGAVQKLEAALSDPRNFGMAKSLFMAGRGAGFDMDSKEGIEAWMRSVQGTTLPPSVPLPSDRIRSGRKTKGTAQARKARRKAASASRKRNR